MITGHLKQREFLKKLCLGDRLPGAIMLSGSAGTGKRLVALELAKTVFCERGENYGGCGTCKSCLLFEKRSLPDLTILDCQDKEQINTEKTRELLYSLNLHSFGSGKKIIILDNAESLSQHIANVLLKSIEEPRPGNHFILICSNPYKLPATLLSRCQIWYFNRLSGEEVKTIIKNLEASGSQVISDLLKDFSIDALCSIADGTLANLFDLGVRADLWQEIKASLESLLNGDMTQAINLASMIAKDKDNMRASLHLLQNILHVKLRENPNGPDAAGLAAALSGLITSESLIFERNVSAVHLLNYILCDLHPSRRAAALTGSTDLAEVTFA